MDRQEYNACMSPYMKGSKSKEQRKHDMCIGAKLCSGKASSEQEAEALCNMPVLPKWAKGKQDTEDIACPARMERVRGNLDTIVLKVHEGLAGEVKEAAVATMQDIYTCHKDNPVIYELAVEALGKFNAIANGGFYFKNEGREIENQLEALKAII